MARPLLDALKAGAPSRIVNGSGGIEAAGKIDFEDLQGEKKFGGFKALSQSKLGSPEVEGVTGAYYVKRKPAKSSARSHDKELAARLWKVSAELTGLKV